MKYKNNNASYYEKNSNQRPSLKSDFIFIGAILFFILLYIASFFIILEIKNGTIFYFLLGVLFCLVLLNFFFTELYYIYNLINIGTKQLSIEKCRGAFLPLVGQANIFVTCMCMPYIWYSNFYFFQKKGFNLPIGIILVCLVIPIISMIPVFLNIFDTGTRIKSIFRIFVMDAIVYLGLVTWMYESIIQSL